VRLFSVLIQAESGLDEKESLRPVQVGCKKETFNVKWTRFSFKFKVSKPDVKVMFWPLKLVGHHEYSGVEFLCELHQPEYGYL
jgi:hypothetical protein